MMALGWRMGGIMGISLFFSLSRVDAQGLRDPTVPPGLTDNADGTKSPSGALSGSLSVIVVDGRPHVMVGTRLYALGQKLGQARIERITETEVWLREGGELRKVPKFAGVQRRSVSPAATRSSKTSLPGAAGESTQP